MTADAPTIFLVDDDPGVIRALSILLQVSGYEVRSFSSAREFLSQHDPQVPGCAVFDVAMPDLDGLELQNSLLKDKVLRPVIFITGYGDIPTSVRAMRAGAVDFLTKPVNDEHLLQAITRAILRDADARKAGHELELIKAQFAKLTPREYEVLTHVIAGRLNKQIAHDLGTVVNTIKVHRGRVMEKLGVKSVADLTRLAQRAGIAAVTGKR
jgi:FixJ family two-component response regulator